MAHRYYTTKRAANTAANKLYQATGKTFDVIKDGRGWRVSHNDVGNHIFDEVLGES